MSWLVIEDGTRRLTLRDEGFAVEHRGEVITRVPVRELEMVHVWGRGAVTPAARSLALRNGIEIAFFDHRGGFLGRLAPPEPRSGARRRAQVAASLELERRVQIARCFVYGKLRNQYAALRRHQRQLRSESVADAMALQRSAAERAATTEDLAVLRGVEGYATASYFGVLDQTLTNPLFRFEGRNRRPPRDPVNAALSLAYTLLYVRLTSAVAGVGLDPYVGFLHDAGRGHAALASDLEEEWRPLVDSLVLSLFNRRQLSPEDFVEPDLAASDITAPESATEGAEGAGDSGKEEPREPEDDHRPVSLSKPVYLSKVGRRILYAAWHKRLRSRLWYPEGRGRFELDEILRRQVLQLARVCEDPALEYRPFSLR